MSLEQFLRRAAQRGGSDDTLTGLLTWLAVRLSGLLLLGLALFHLIYMHFIAPGGVAQLDYQAIAARWTGPAWGFTWRLFDLLLLGLALTHGVIGAGKMTREKMPAAQTLIRGLLLLAWLLLLGLGASIVFTFQA